MFVNHFKFKKKLVVLYLFTSPKIVEIRKDKINVYLFLVFELHHQFEVRVWTLLYFLN